MTARVYPELLLRVGYGAAASRAAKRETSHLMKTRPSNAIEMDALMLLLPMLQVDSRWGVVGNCLAAAAAHGVSSNVAVATRAVIEHIRQM